MDKEETPASKKSALVSRLKQERERHGWSQSELAKRINTTQANVSRWEKGLTIPGPYYRRKLAEVFEKTLEDLGFFAGATGENDEVAHERFAPTMPPAIPEPVWNVPYRRNPFFTGRSLILDSLYATLTSHRTAASTQALAISGLGGIGKTQIAVEYAYRSRDYYQAVLWVNASSHETLIGDFVELATLLALPERQEQDQHIVVAAIKRWLSTHDNWLMILDNVEDAEMIAEFFPAQGMGNILLTTRLQAMGAIAQGIEVEKMSLDDGVLFLLRRTKLLPSGETLNQAKQRYQPEVEEIVSELDGLPLALDQAGAYIEETRCSFSAYQKRYHTRRKELLQRRGKFLFEHPEPVATTWSLSFQDVELESPAAADLLRLLAFLSPEAISEELLSEGASEFGPVLSPIASDPLELDDALALLLGYSLIWRNPDTQLLSMHRLVQAVLKDTMQPTRQALWAERAIRAVNKVFPEVRFDTWAQCQRCLPHAQISATHIEEYALAFPEAARLLTQAALYLSSHAQYGQAETFLRQALAIREQVLAPEHPDRAATLNDLGMLYLIQGKYQQATPLLEQTLKFREQLLGQEHAATAASLNNLALLYSAQGKYLLAEELLQRALSIRQCVLETDHPEIAQSQRNLAELYIAQGKYAAAETLYLQARCSQEKALGLHHPEMAKTLNDLALLYRSRGEYEQAERFYQQALSIQEALLGSAHPDVAQTLNNLARLYRAQGKYAQAEPLYQRALTIRQEVFGREHPQVALSLHGLAKLYNSQGRYQQAENVGTQALRIQERQLGNDHPDVAYTLGTLAKIYQGQQRLEEASAANLRALHIREQTSDANHPHVALLNNNQAEIYHAQSKYRAAEPLIARSLAIHRQILGESHPYIAYSLSNLAQNYVFQGDYAQAEALYLQALAVREQSLGTRHPRTASTYQSLAQLYRTLARPEEAEAFYRKAQAIREQTLGSEHPIVVTGMEQFIAFLREAGKYEQASELEARVQVSKEQQSKATDE